MIVIAVTHSQTKISFRYPEVRGITRSSKEITITFRAVNVIAYNSLPGILPQHCIVFYFHYYILYRFRREKVFRNGSGAIHYRRTWALGIIVFTPASPRRGAKLSTSWSSPLDSDINPARGHRRCADARGAALVTAMWRGGAPGCRVIAPIYFVRPLQRDAHYRSVSIHACCHCLRLIWSW